MFTMVWRPPLLVGTLAVLLFIASPSTSPADLRSPGDDPLAAAAHRSSDTVYPRFIVPLEFSDFGGEVRRDTFGVHPHATYCVDGLLDGGLEERELPPKPPSGAPDARFTDHRSPPCLGAGLRVHLQEDTKRDTFRVEYQPGNGGFPMTIRWPGGLSEGFSALSLRDLFGGFLVDVDMLAESSAVITNASLTTLLIIADPLPLTWDHSIQATAGPGGTITPVGIVLVADGGTQSFSIQPDPGYVIDSLVVDGIAIGGSPSYTFTNVSANHSLHATFLAVPGWSDGYLVPITLRENGPTIRIDTFGVYPGAGYCIDGTLGPGIVERELPPSPPAGSPDFRFIDHRSGPGACLGVGVRLHLQEIGKLDTFRMAFQPGPGGYPLRLYWPAGLDSHWSSLIIEDLFGGGIVSQDMLTTTTLEIVNPAITGLQVIGFRPLIIPQYSIAAGAGPGGTIVPNGVVIVDAGGTQGFSIAPDPGYRVDSVVVDGVSVGAVTAYTFSNVAANHAIQAHFSRIPYVIQASAGPGGSINPNGPVVVLSGGSRTFSITPTAGFFIANVHVDTLPVGPTGSYTFTNVQANHTIHATFDPVVPPGAVIVPISLTDAGSISRTDTFGVHQNATYCIDGVLTPALAEIELPPKPPTGAIDLRFVDHRSGVGACLGVGVRLHLQEPEKLDTFKLDFQPGAAGYPVTISWPPGLGSAWESLSLRDAFGGLFVNLDMLATTNVVVTNTAITTLIITGRSSSTGPQHTITATAGPGGSISPAGAVTVPAGGNRAFLIQPSAGHSVDSVLVDGLRVDSLASYTFTNVSSDHTIHATFRADSGGSGLFRTFTPLDLGERKSVSRRPLFHEFSVPFVNSTGQAAIGLHLRFVGHQSAPVQVTAAQPFAGLTTANGREWEASGGSIAPGETVLVRGTSARRPATILRWRWRFPAADGPDNPRMVPGGQIPKYAMPNAANVREELFDGGFGVGGLVVGRDRSDSARHFGWVRITSGVQMRRSMNLNGRTHQGVARCFDFFRERPSLIPQLHDNVLFANLAALKFNIRASMAGLTPPGFGELEFLDSLPHPLDGLTLHEIAARADSLLSGYYAGGDHLCDGTGTAAQVSEAIGRINAAFAGPLDTASYASGLVLTGVRDVRDVTFLRKSATADPLTIVWERSPIDGGVPISFGLHQNYPNPFNPTTTIRFELPWEATVILVVHNLLGEEVARLADNETFSEGAQELEFDASRLASGPYYYRLTAISFDPDDELRPASFSAVRKMVLVK